MSRAYLSIARQYETDVLDGTVPACQWVERAIARNQRDVKAASLPGALYRFDEEAASRVCAFVETMPHILGEFAKPVSQLDGSLIWPTIVLEPWQCWILTTVFGWLRVADGKRRFRGALILVPRKNGKALALDTEVPTPAGVSKIADLRVGDAVYGADGHETSVVAVSEVLTGRACYEVEFSTGETFVADANHQWLTTARVDSPGAKNRRGSKRGPGMTRVRTTQELADSCRFGSRGDRNHSVMLAAPVRGLDVTLSIDPYSLGVWLGDGTSASGTFTCADEEIIDQIRSAEGEVRVGQQKGAARTYRIGPSFRAGTAAAETFQGRLRSLGVLGNKHIPRVYLRASLSQRLALLQGLMDTDGTTSKAGQSTFCSTTQALARQVLELVASLGMKPSLTSRPAKIDGRTVGTAYQVQFWPGDLPAFRLQRKLARQKPVSATGRSRTRQIVSVRPVHSVPVKCIQVANDDGLFLIGRSFIPTHNSALLSALCNYMLTADGEPGAKCYSAATTRDQAKIVAETAYEMALRLPQYREWFGIKLGAKTKRTFGVPATASTMEPLSADASTLDGLNIHFAAVDELHAHPTRHVWDVLETATGARDQPLLFAISTAGVNMGGICYELLIYLRKLLQQAAFDETFFGVEYTCDEDDDPFAEATHKKANPNWGVSVKPDDLERKALKARTSPAALNNYLTKHLNIWCREETTWAPLDPWIAGGDKTLTPEQFAGSPCWIGVDLAEVRDVAATVRVFKVSPTQLACFFRLYVPKEGVLKSPIAQYQGWVHEKALIETDGDQADYQRIEDDIFQDCQRFKVQAVCFDRALAAQMGQSLTRRLGMKPPVITVNQNVDVMNPAMQTVERLILSGQLAHDGNPAVTWMMSNIVVQRNYKDEIFPRKAGGKDSPNKIDGPVALFTVIGQVMLEAPQPEYSMFFVGGGPR